MHTSEDSKLKRGLLACWLLSLLLSWLMVSTPWIQSIEYTWQDWLAQQRAEAQQPDRRIVIIDIDDTSLQAMAPLVGKWPWPRSVHAELLEYLLSQQAQAIVLDLLLSEADRFRPDSDRYLNEVIAGSDRIYLAALEQTLIDTSQAPLISGYPSTVAITSTANAHLGARASLLLPTAIDTQAWRLGLINFTADGDGSGRRYTLYRHWQGWSMPTLATKVALDLGVNPPQENDITLAWTSPNAISHTRLSYATVLSQARGEQNPIPVSLLQNSIVIIGSTAAGLHDLRATPISSLHPGSFILATALDNLLNQEHIQSTSLLLQIMLSVGLLSAIFLLSLKLGTIAGLCASAILLSIAVAVSYFSLVKIDTHLPLLPSLLAIVLGSLSISSINYWRNQRRYRNAVALFNQVMDPKVVKQLLAHNDPESLLESKSCELTVLFSDIRDFTTLSETRTPKEVVNLLNNYFEQQVSALFRHGATVDKFIGDAVMAFWGAPLPSDNAAVNAIEAAMEMLDNLEGFKKKYGYKDFSLGIGIHTGSAVVGMVGTQQRADYTAIGDSVNVASRIEGLTKNRALLLVSQETMQAAGTHFTFIDHGEFLVKGRSCPVRVYEPRRLPS